VVKLDCLDLASVRGFTAQARDFLEAGGAGPSASGLRLVVNNAGVMGAPQAASADGFEPSWATNFLAPFASTELLAGGRRPGAADIGGPGGLT
jgi:NAD(P)-dependent dehydrogenase (short-subunit alcohol dehydrogenase family)